MRKEIKTPIYFETKIGIFGGDNSGPYRDEDEFIERTTKIIYKDFEHQVVPREKEHVIDYKLDTSSQRTDYSNQIPVLNQDSFSQHLNPCYGNNQYAGAVSLVNGYGSYLNDDDCRDIVKKRIVSQMDMDFDVAKRTVKNEQDKSLYVQKKAIDIEATDIRENMLHHVKEENGFLYYVTEATGHKIKISNIRYIHAELLDSHHPGDEPVVHICGENNGVHSCFMTLEEFYTDGIMVEKLETSGIQIKFSRRNKNELIRELRHYLATLFGNNEKVISHHQFWNRMPDGTVRYIASDEESLESITESAEIIPADNAVDTWACIKTDPFRYLKLLLLIAFNRVSYLLTELIGVPKRCLLLLVANGQKQFALSLFKGARQVTEHMNLEDIGKLLTSTYSGFVVYIYKEGRVSSNKIVQTISEIVQDGVWCGKKITTIPLIISEKPLPAEAKCDCFTIVENNDLSNLKFDDLILSENEMNDLIKDYPGLCGNESINSVSGYLLFAGLYLVRTLNSECCTEEGIRKLITDLIDSDQNEEGVTGDSEEFIAALYSYLLEDVSVYDVDYVPEEFSISEDLLFDDTYIYLFKECIDKIIALMDSDTGIETVKSTLVEDKILIPYRSSTYTAKCTYSVTGKSRTKVAYRLEREMLHKDSFRRPDAIKFYNMHKNQGGNDDEE